MKERKLVAQLYTTVCNSMDCSSSAHGFLQAKVQEWVAISFPRGSSPTQGSDPGLPHCRRLLYQLNYKGSPDHSQRIIQKYHSWACIWRQTQSERIQTFQRSLQCCLQQPRHGSNLSVHRRMKGERQGTYSQQNITQL